MFRSLSVQSREEPQQALIEERLEREVGDLMCSLPDPTGLSSLERRGIIARYAAVLEGNFIYWMTAAYLSARSEEARSIILENLSEEVRDCHPGMMRRFALAAGAFPTESDAMAVDRDLASVRLLAGRLSALQVVVMMAFFEAFIQGFMAFLAELAGLQGSTERQYTDVHGVCDIAHSRELLRAVGAELALVPEDSATDPFEGVDLLRSLILTILQPAANSAILHN